MYQSAVYGEDNEIVSSNILKGTFSKNTVSGTYVATVSYGTTTYGNGATDSTPEGRMKFLTSSTPVFQFQVSKPSVITVTWKFYKYVYNSDTSNTIYGFWGLQFVGNRSKKSYFPCLLINTAGWAGSNHSNCGFYVNNGITKTTSLPGTTGWYGNTTTINIRDLTNCFTEKDNFYIVNFYNSKQYNYNGTVSTITPIYVSSLTIE